MARVLSAAGWDDRFRPSEAAFEEWKAALAPRRTARPTLTGLAFLGVFFLWAKLWPGRAPWALLTLAGVSLVVVFWLAIDNLRAIGRSERRLLEEYRAWQRANGDRV